MTWASRTKWLRRRLGLEQKQLAKVMNVSPAAVCRWEKGDLVPEGGNRQLLDALYRQAKEKQDDELAEIGKEVLKIIAISAAVTGLILLLGALFKE